MTPRAMWKAVVQLGSLEVPVKLYAAVEQRDVHFRLLHREDQVPVAQRMVDPRTDEPVAAEAVRRGIEVSPGRWVTFTEEELASTVPPPSRTIEILRCVPRGSIDLAWFGRPYHLGPDGSPGEAAALAAALRESERVGIARWVMRSKRYFGMLEAGESHLALVSMRPASEAVGVDQLGMPETTATTRPAERTLARQLIEALDAPFEPSELRDEYRDRVEELIAAKRAGRPPRKIHKVRLPEQQDDLATVLRESLRRKKGAGGAAA